MLLVTFSLFQLVTAYQTLHREKKKLQVSDLLAIHIDSYVILKLGSCNKIVLILAFNNSSYDQSI